jgi:hypothetical protein
MKKLSLLLIVMMCFVRIGFGQVNPDVRAGEGRGLSCDCGEKGVNISTGFNNGTNTTFQVGQAENQWKIISGPNGVQNPTAFSSTAWDANNNNSTWIIPKGENAGDYVYEYKFTIPAGSTGNLKLKRIGADDRVNAKLDANPDFFAAGDIAGWYAKATLKKCIELNNIPAGTHSLLFNVKNMGGITGLLVEGCLDFIKIEAPVVTFEDTKCCIGTNAKNLSTGFGNSANSLIANGMADDDWKITNTPSGAANAVVSNAISVSPSYAPSSSKAQWLLAKGKYETGLYTFERTIAVPAGMEANLSFSRIGGDNEVEMTLISGANTTSIYKSNFPGPVGGLAFKPTNVILKSCKVVQRLAPGTHKIVCTVNNDGGDAGLLVEGCYELVQTVPECKCPAGWLSNTSNKDGDITTDGKCKKMICGPLNIKPAPKNGTQVDGNLGFFWDNNLYWYGTKENGGFPVCTLNGKVIDWSVYQATQGRGE